MGNAANLFAQIGSATGGSYRYFSPGTFVVDLGKVELKDTDDGPKFIVEATVVESSRPDYKAGDKVSWVTKLYGKTKDSALGEVKSFVCALGELDEEKTSEEKIGAATALVCSDKQPFLNKRARLVCDEPREGKKFVKHHWTPNT